jgi:hypothetical protein
MEVSDSTKSMGQPAELNCLMNEMSSDMDYREVDMDVGGEKVQQLSTEDVQPLYRKNDGKHMRSMKDCLVQIEDEGMGRKFIRRASNSNIKNVDTILETGQLCHGKDVCSDSPSLVDNEDLGSGDFTDSVGRNSKSSSAGNSSRNSPLLVIDNRLQSSDYFYEIKDTTNSFQSKILSCELDMQNPCEGNITEESGFGNKIQNVSLNLEESDPVVKASDDGECPDTVHGKITFDHGDNFSINTDLSSVDSKKCYDDPKDRMCIKKVLVNNDHHKKDESDEYRVQEEQNRKNRRIIRGSVTSDVLIISDPDSVADVTPSQVGSGAENSLSPNHIVNKKKRVQQKEDITVETSGPTLKEHSADTQKSHPLSVNLNRDECTWDMMFDDNGDCLDPKLMEEVSILYLLCSIKLSIL